MNFGHPLAAGLAFASVVQGGGTAVLDCVSRVQGATALPSWTVGGLSGYGWPGGEGLLCSAGNANYASFSGLADAPFLGPLTIVWFGILAAAGAGTYNALASKCATNGATDCPFDFRTDVGSNQVYLIRASGSGFGQAATPGAVTFADNILISIAVTTPSSQLADANTVFYYNGVVTGPTGIAGGGGTVTGAGAPLRLGRRPDGAVQLSGAVFATYIWSRALPADQISWITAEPYAFLAGSKLSRPFLVFSTTFGGEYDGSVWRTRMRQF